MRRELQVQEQMKISRTTISPRSPIQLLPLLLLLLLLHCGGATAVLYKVGDLDSWGIPPSSKPNLYATWSQLQHFAIGDSLLFLYPPSQDSVIQVTEHAFRLCHTTAPILKLDDGNSVFNLTAPGWYYFISSVTGHCQKHQKLVVAVPLPDGALPPVPADTPDASDIFTPVSAPDSPSGFGPSASERAGSPPPVVALGLSAGAGSLLALALVGAFGF